MDRPHFWFGLLIFCAGWLDLVRFAVPRVAGGGGVGTMNYDAERIAFICPKNKPMGLIN